MAPSNTHGAVSAPHLRPAMKVWVRQWPKGASATRRSPRRMRPRSRVIFVVTAVSSMNTRRAGQLTHERLARYDPFAPPLTHLGASALRGHQGFFYM